MNTVTGYKKPEAINYETLGKVLHAFFDAFSSTKKTSGEIIREMDSNLELALVVRRQLWDGEKLDADGLDKWLTRHNDKTVDSLCFSSDGFTGSYEWQVINQSPCNHEEQTAKDAYNEWIEYRDQQYALEIAQHDAATEAATKEFHESGEYEKHFREFLHDVLDCAIDRLPIAFFKGKDVESCIFNVFDHLQPIIKKAA